MRSQRQVILQVDRWCIQQPCTAVVGGGEVAPATAYTLVLHAVNALGASELGSNHASVTTLAAAPDKVSAEELQPKRA